MDSPCQICGGWHQPLPVSLCLGCKILYYRQCHTPHISDEAKFSWLCSYCKEPTRNSDISNGEQMPTPQRSPLPPSISLCVSLPSQTVVRCNACHRMILNGSTGSKWCKICKAMMSLESDGINRVGLEADKLRLQTFQTTRVSKPIFSRSYRPKIRKELVTTQAGNPLKKEIQTKLNLSLLTENNQTITQTRKRNHVEAFSDLKANHITAPFGGTLGSLVKEKKNNINESHNGHGISQHQSLDNSAMKEDLETFDQNLAAKTYETEKDASRKPLPVSTCEQRLDDEPLWGYIDPRRHWPPWPDITSEEDLDAVLSARRTYNRQFSRAKFPIGGSYET